MEERGGIQIPWKLKDLMSGRNRFYTASEYLWPSGRDMGSRQEITLSGGPLLITIPQRAWKETEETTHPKLLDYILEMSEHPSHGDLRIHSNKSHSPIPIKPLHRASSSCSGRPSKSTRLLSPHGDPHNSLARLAKRYQAPLGDFRKGEEVFEKKDGRGLQGLKLPRLENLCYF